MNVLNTVFMRRIWSPYESETRTTSGTDASTAPAAA